VKETSARLLTSARAGRLGTAATGGLALTTTVLVVAQASLIAHAIARASEGASFVSLRPTLIAFLAIVLARAASAWGGEAVALRAAAAVKSALRRDLVRHTVGLGPEWSSERRNGELVTLTTRGLDALDAYFSRYLPAMVLAAIMPIEVIIRIGVADLTSALIVLFTLPLIPVFMVLVGVHTKQRTDRRWRLLALLGGHFLDVVQGLPTLKVFDRAHAQVTQLRDVTEEHRRETMGTLRTAFLSAFVLELTATLSTAVVAVEVGLRLLDGHLPYETALLVLLLTPEAYLPLRSLSLHYHASMEGMAAAEQAFAVLDQPLPVRTRSRSVPEEFPCPLRLTGVTVRYPGRATPVLDGLSLLVGAGESVALVGPSGAGKSTLLTLLLGFSTPDDGTLSCGDVDLAEIDLHAWRQHVAWVPQRPHLFAGTVADNIKLGRPLATDDEVRRAVALARADDFVTALPEGYATRLGERGETLSAGERQRLALARAFLRDTPVLLLDEPTAHLDRRTARQVQESVAQLMVGRTVIVVAHDRSWCEFTDRVVSLDAGRPAERPRERVTL
jgi:ATP-binding cassette subfamily C protein CydD